LLPSVQPPQLPAKVEVAKAAKAKAVTVRVRSDFITLTPWHRMVWGQRDLCGGVSGVTRVAKPGGNGRRALAP
jgi:hypothetical protein